MFGQCKLGFLTIVAAIETQSTQRRCGHTHWCAIKRRHAAKANAALVLFYVSEHEQHVESVVAAGAIEVCVVMLQTGPDDANVNAMLALLYVSEHEQHVESVVAAGVITTILDGMHSTSPDFNFIPASTLAILSAHLDVSSGDVMSIRATVASRQPVQATGGCEPEDCDDASVERVLQVPSPRSSASFDARATSFHHRRTVLDHAR